MQTLLGIVAVIVGAIIAFKVLFILFHLVGWLIAIGGTVIWIAALVHIAFSQFSSSAAKAIWFIIVLFTHVIGALIYFVLGRPNNVVRRYV
jgi:hypothetical protein